MEITLDEIIKDVNEVERRARESEQTDEMITSTALEVVKTALEKEKITILTDYDADGITSAYIMERLLKSVNPQCKIDVQCNDRRKSYGLDTDIQGDSDTSYIVCDMGCNQLNLAQERLGDDVIIIDHHLFDDKEAEAKFASTANARLCNPHALNEDDSNNAQYCAAGLAYRIYCNAKEICATQQKEFHTSEKQENTVLAMACIGTATDMVSVLDPNSYNRKILKDGINIIDNADENNFDFVLGYVLANCKINERTTAHQLAFNVGAFLNSASRMSELIGENGAQLMYDALSADKDKGSTYKNIDSLIKTNEERKAIVGKVTSSEDYQAFVQQHRYGNKATDNIAVYTLPDNMPSAFAGLVANKLTDALDKAVICLVYNDKNKAYTGSGRNVENNVTGLKDFLDKALEGTDIDIQYGGHENAIGISRLDNLERFVDLIDKAKDQMVSKDWSERQLLKISPSELTSEETISKIQSLEPLGTGLKIPPALLVGKELRQSQGYIKGRSDWKRIICKDLPVSVIDWSYSPDKYPPDKDGNIQILTELAISTYNNKLKPSIEPTAKFDRAFCANVQLTFGKSARESAITTLDNTVQR